ncbi:hypothetical protein NHX12_001464 [Muraenolepis orangiensis]|uniref:Ig-like domain-containing protein n=1 Tax=Muraenolepis orangiensis TaxID=630683 RepID=A0A9Q0DYH7_9TELE|nr:hypothetical protein NHX12_001464 [Muraenolepis orangiensis]
MEVQEGSPVRLSCSAIITCPLLPPMLSWRPSLGDAREETRGEQMEVVYAYQSALDRRGEEEDLHYVNVIFTPLAENPEVDYIRGMDSKTAEYAQIRPHHT